MLLHALLKALGLNCCSNWFEQFSSRIHNCRAIQGFSSRRSIVPRLWNGDRHIDRGHSNHPYLRSIHRTIPLRHRSKFRHVSRTTLHCWSLRVWRRSVCNCDHSDVAKILNIGLLHLLFALDRQCNNW